MNIWADNEGIYLRRFARNENKFVGENFLQEAEACEELICEQTVSYLHELL